MPRRARLYLLTVRLPEAVADLVATALVDAGAGGVQQEVDADEEVGTLRVYAAERAPLLGFARSVRTLAAGAGFPCWTRTGPAPPSTAGWETSFTASLVPVRVSRTLILEPRARAAAGPPPAHTLWLEPARAFGFGDHPTTRLAAAAVERLCRTGRPRVLDVGTGTGVLALVAATRGAGTVLGIDVDPEAVTVAERNRKRNARGAKVRFSTTPLSRLRARFDLVVANLDYRTLLELAPAVLRRLAPRGTVLLTGFLSRDARDILGRYGELGLVKVARSRAEGGFALLTLGRRARGSSSRSPAGPPPRPRGTRRTPRSR